MGHRQDDNQMETLKNYAKKKKNPASRCPSSDSRRSVTSGGVCKGVVGCLSEGQREEVLEVCACRRD